MPKFYAKYLELEEIYIFKSRKERDEWVKIEEDNVTSYALTPTPITAKQKDYFAFIFDLVLWHNPCPDDFPWAALIPREKLGGDYR